MFVRGRRMAGVWAVAAVALALTTACTPAPGPQPSPSPTGFASEEEAFAAAEETYRAYVDALNQVDLSDPETFEPVYAWLAADSLESSKKTFSEMHANGWTVNGPTNFDQATLKSARGHDVVLELCLDVTQVDVLDADQNSVVPEDRLDRQPLQVTFGHANTASGLVITDSDAIESALCGM
ncbi:hypothetical protein FVP74_13430 [Microbacterium saccharophilum]|uniref:Lipoprotein n=1 Tax=Microbacterium saccharophilum TaxID=1213358 RepID=A0A5C8HS76_9MICO|nr:hypothetical protein [Microbacterium saccharophilum]TXK08693.1 hypothetical protein FVP74_13430 [Microbacterium saccharophilum]